MKVTKKIILPILVGLLSGYTISSQVAKYQKEKSKEEEPKKVEQKREYFEPEEELASLNTLEEELKVNRFGGHGFLPQKREDPYRDLRLLVLERSKNPIVLQEENPFSYFPIGIYFQRNSETNSTPTNSLETITNELKRPSAPNGLKIPKPKNDKPIASLPDSGSTGLMLLSGLGILGYLSRKYNLN